MLQDPRFQRLAEQYGTTLVTDLLREELARLRSSVASGKLEQDAFRNAVEPAALHSRVEDAARRLLAPAPAAVINATGVVVHTNLGRATLSEAAARRVAEASVSYMSLEYDLARGARGSRMSHLDPLLGRLFPGWSCLAVNNNAAAILLALHTLAGGREVIVSRGELVEIGGSFRIPDILGASGARLREVGTTNRTRLADYERALSAKSALLLKVHTSNFRVVGFTEETEIRDLAALARRARIPLVVDWGSGNLLDLTPLGIPDEIPVSRILRDGADVVAFSADKLLGGPQAGILVGQEAVIDRLKKSPLARVLRIGRLQIAALRETLSSYVRDKALEEVPTLRMLSLSREEIGARAERILRDVARRTGAGSRLRIVDGISRTGGGSSPTGERPTRLLAIGGDGTPERLERALRTGDVPVVARIHDGEVVLDLRTVLPQQDEALTEILVRSIGTDDRARAASPDARRRSGSSPRRRRA
jgi:L-seryl-tRNA(Ser) seleniumtransferase